MAKVLIVEDDEVIAEGMARHLSNAGFEPIRPIGLLAFGLALAGITLGSSVQRRSERQLNTNSKEVVKLSLGILATLAALVLGLLIASAKTTYSAREGEINQITAYVILLDNLLAKYGEGAQAARASLRKAISPMVNQIWREARSVERRPFKATAEGEVFYQQIEGFNQATTSNEALSRGH